MSAAEDRLNTVLARVQLLDGEQVYRAALNVDSALVLLLEDARRREWSREEWRRRRRPALSGAVKHFQESARRQLGTSPVNIEIREAPSGEDGSLRGDD